MKKIKILFMTLILLINTLVLTGCWNYKEVDELAIVGGVAIDKDENDEYELTVEIVKISGGKDSKSTSAPITMKGKTIFDAVRNGIAIVGKRLYWSHAKVIILSEQVAREGLTKVVDWYIRDSETRENVVILIAKGNSAKDILTTGETTEDIKSMALDEVIKSQQGVSKAPKTDLLDFCIETKLKGTSTVIPVINLIEMNSKKTPQIMGSGIIKDKKLIGFLDGEETKALLFIRNQVKGGILIEGVEENTLDTPVTFEIFKSKTNVKPVIQNNNNITIKLDIKTTAAIDEIDGPEDIINEEGHTKLERVAERKLNKQVEALIKKVQTEYGADIFGFAVKIYEDKPNVWKKVGKNWEANFKDLKVDITSKIHIKNSAILSKTIKEGD